MSGKVHSTNSGKLPKAGEMRMAKMTWRTLNRPRRKIWIGVVLLLIFAGAWLALRNAIWREPSYEGRSLSEWIDDYDIEGGRYPGSGHKNKQSTQAVRSIGSNGVPFFIAWIHSKDSPLKTKVARFLNEHSFTNFHFSSAEEQQERAFKGFWILGESGLPAVPALVKSTQSSDPELRVLAFRCLIVMDPDKEVLLPILKIYADDKDEEMRMLAKATMTHLKFREASSFPTNGSPSQKE